MRRDTRNVACESQPTGSTNCAQICCRIITHSFLNLKTHSTPCHLSCKSSGSTSTQQCIHSPLSTNSSSSSDDEDEGGIERSTWIRRSLTQSRRNAWWQRNRGDRRRSVDDHIRVNAEYEWRTDRGRDLWEIAEAGRQAVRRDAEGLGSMWTTGGPVQRVVGKGEQVHRSRILEMDYTDEHWERRYTVRVNILPLLE